MSKSKITGVILILVVGVSSFYLQDLFASQDRSLTPGSEYAKKMLQKKCEVQRTGTEWADVKCSLDEFKNIERDCNVYVRSGDLSQASLLCNSSQARWVQRDCKVWMSGISEGELACLDKAKARVVRFMSRYEGTEQKRTNIFGN